MVSHGFCFVYMFFQDGSMVFHGFGLVYMVFQGGLMVFHGFWLVSMVFEGGQWPVPAAREKQSGDILHILHILCAPKCT